MAALAAAGALAAIPAVAAELTVTANPNNTFGPRDLSVSPGDSVTWTNGGGDHNVKFTDGQFEQPAEPAPPGSWPAAVRRAFTTPGSYRYYCENHGDSAGGGMAGTVTVGQPPGTPPAAGGNTPPPGGPAPRAKTRVTLTASEPTPRRGQRIRLFGSVRPRRDGTLVLLERRRRDGTFATVARTRLRPSTGGRSSYSRRLRVFRDGVLRARVRADAGHLAGVSARKRIDVH